MHAGINRLNVYPVPDGDTGTNMARTLDAVVAEMERGRVELDRDVRRDQPRLVDGRSRQQRRHPEPDPPRDDVDGGGSRRRDAYPRRRRPDSSRRRRLPGRAPSRSRARSSPWSRVGRSGALPRRGGGALTRRCVAGSSRRSGRAALDSSPELLPVLKDAGVVDAGGRTICYCSTRPLHVVGGDPLPDARARARVRRPTSTALAPIALGGRRRARRGEQRYEVMYFCELPDSRIADFDAAGVRSGTRSWSSGATGCGDCHVHTNDVGAGEIEVALDRGRAAEARSG